MGRDPLDTSLDVLIDQALSVNAQLRWGDLARGWLAGIGVDAAAVAETVLAGMERATDARSQRDRAAALATLTLGEGAKLLAETRTWLERTRLALNRAALDAPQAAAAALSTLRRARSLTDMQTAVRVPVATMQARRAELSVVAHVTLLMEEGAGLADRIDQWKVKSDERLAARAVAAEKAKQEGIALRATLRELRRIWRSAAIGNPLMPPLDLSLAAGAVATRRQGPPQATVEPGGGDGATAGDGGTPGSGAAGDAPTSSAASGDSVDGAAPGSDILELTPCGADATDDEQDGRTTVTVRHAFEVRVVEAED